MQVFKPIESFFPPHMSKVIAFLCLLQAGELHYNKVTADVALSKARKIILLNLC